jgi:hypothetical protein
MPYSPQKPPATSTSCPVVNVEICTPLLKTWYGSTIGLVRSITIEVRPRGFID